MSQQAIKPGIKMCTDDSEDDPIPVTLSTMTRVQVAQKMTPLKMTPLKMSQKITPLKMSQKTQKMTPMKMSQKTQKMTPMKMTQKKMVPVAPMTHAQVSQKMIT